MKQYMAILGLLFCLPGVAITSPLRFYHLTTKDGVPQGTILGIDEDKYGFIWFGTGNGLCRYDGYEVKVYLPEEGDTFSVPGRRVNKVYVDWEDNVWVACLDASQIARYDYERDRFVRVNYEEVPARLIDSLKRYEPFVHSTVENETYRWQVTSENRHLTQLDKQTGRTYTYWPDPLDPWAITDKTVTQVFMDSQGNLWVGTMGNGLCMADTKQKPIRHYYRNEAMQTIANDVRSLAMDKAGRVWMGTREDGVTLYDPQENSYVADVFKRFERHPNRIVKQIRALCFDAKGRLWIGTRDGLRRYDPKTGAFDVYMMHTPISIPHNWVYALYHDSQGNVWVGTFNGFARYDVAAERMQVFNWQHTLQSPKVRAFQEDRDGRLWVGTEVGGLTCLGKVPKSGHPVDFHPTHYRHEAENPSSLSNDVIYALNQDEKGFLWVATPDGLNRFDPQKGLFKRISTEHGLPDKMIMAVLSDQQGSIWVSHKKGLSRLSLDGKVLNNFNHSHGLQDNDFSESACFRDTTTGELYFGGIRGVNAFKPSAMRPNTHPPKVYITQLSLLNTPIRPGMPFNGRTVLEKAVSLTKKLVLTHKDRTVTVAFTALHYANPKGNRYKHRLVGFDKSWIETDASNRVAHYSNLKPGTYVFEVMGANADGVWNPQPTTLTLEVRPPWWLSTGAFIAYVLLVSMLLFLAYRIIIAQVTLKHQVANEKLNAQRLAEFDRLKSAFFTHVAHELRTPLTLILDPLEKLMDDKRLAKPPGYYYALMHKSVSRLHRLINQLLDFTKLEAGHTVLEMIPNEITGQLATITEAFEVEAEERGMRLSFKAETQPLMFDYDKDSMDKILYNLLGNAFKYTPNGGEVTVWVGLGSNTTGQCVQIAVEDTGIGIPDGDKERIFDVYFRGTHNEMPADAGFGIGLAYAKELVERMGGHITVDAGKKGGTVFRLSFPYKDLVVAVKDKAIVRKTAVGAVESVLLIEDNEAVRSYLAGEMEDDFVVIQAENGTVGFDRAVEQQPELIVSDVMMPGLDGLTLCSRLKADVRTSHIPVILLTARQLEKHIVEGYQSGADAYLVKPVSSRVLKARIKNLLSTRNLLKQRFSEGHFKEVKQITHNVTDAAFLSKVVGLILENLEESTLNTETLPEKLKMSRALFYTKIKALTGTTVHHYITTVRLNKAAEWLLSGEYNVSEVAYKVGYSVPANFSRSFAKEFGLSPTEYMEQHRSALL